MNTTAITLTALKTTQMAIIPPSEIPMFGEGGGEVVVVDEAGEVVVDVGAEVREDALEVVEEVAVDRVLYLGQIVCTRILEADVKIAAGRIISADLLDWNVVVDDDDVEELDVEA